MTWEEKWRLMSLTEKIGNALYNLRQNDEVGVRENLNDMLTEIEEGEYLTGTQVASAGIEFADHFVIMQGSDIEDLDEKDLLRQGFIQGVKFMKERLKSKTISTTKILNS